MRIKPGFAVGREPGAAGRAPKPGAAFGDTGLAAVRLVTAKENPMAYIHLTSVIPPKPTCATGNPAGEPAPAVSLPQLHALDIDEWRARFPLIAMAQSSSQCGSPQPRSKLAATEELEREASYRIERSDDESEQAQASEQEDGDSEESAEDRHLIMSVRRAQPHSTEANGNVVAEPAQAKALLGYALRSGAARGDMSLIQALLDQGIKADAEDGAGRTPLLFAIAGGDLQASAMLLRHGADVGRVDERGESALTLAVKTDSVLALHLLRPYLAKLEPARRRELFTTALELAIASEAEAMIEVLGYVGAELHAFDGAQ
jgi:hypothetical protein